MGSNFLQVKSRARIRYKSLSLGLGFLNKGLAVSQSLGLTILYPYLFFSMVTQLDLKRFFGGFVKTMENSPACIYDTFSLS